MAIVREITAPNGVRMRVHDDCYAGISAEELARRKRQISEAILRIDYNWQLREMAAQKDKQKTTEGPTRREPPAVGD